jgi:hypothetical protein
VPAPNKYTRKSKRKQAAAGSAKRPSRQSSANSTESNETGGPGSPETSPSLDDRISEVTAQALEEIRGALTRLGPPITPELPKLKFELKADSPRSPRKRAFLAAYLATAGNITRAAQAAGIDRFRHYEWLEHDKKYKAAFTKVNEQAGDVLEDEARRRAFEGTTKGIYFQGQLASIEVEYSDALLIRLLQAKRPEYRLSTHQIKGTGQDGAIKLSVVPDAIIDRLTESEAGEYLRRLREGLEAARTILHRDDSPGGGEGPGPELQPDPAPIPD